MLLPVLILGLWAIRDYCSGGAVSTPDSRLSTLDSRLDGLQRLHLKPQESQAYPALYSICICICTCADDPAPDRPCACPFTSTPAFPSLPSPAQCPRSRALSTPSIVCLLLYCHPDARVRSRNSLRCCSGTATIPTNPSVAAGTSDIPRPHFAGVSPVLPIDTA
jgi:hypothetical protein